MPAHMEAYYKKKKLIDDAKALQNHQKMKKEMQKQQLHNISYIHSNHHKLAMCHINNAELPKYDGKP